MLRTFSGVKTAESGSASSASLRPTRPSSSPMSSSGLARTRSAFPCRLWTNTSASGPTMAATRTGRRYSRLASCSWSSGAGSAYTAVIRGARPGGSAAVIARHTWLEVKAAITTQSQRRAAAWRKASGPIAMVTMRRLCPSSVRKAAKVGTRRLYKSSAMRALTALPSPVTISKR